MESLIKKLEALQRQMKALSNDMKTYSHDEIYEHGDELGNAAKLVTSWINGIKEEVGNVS